MVSPLGQKRSDVLSVQRKIVIISPFAILINFQQANYLTFGGLLSRNAGDFLGSVEVGVDFCEYLSIRQSFGFQVFAKQALI